MKILHIIEDYSVNSGGLRTVVKDLNEHLNELENIESFILSSQEENGDGIYLVDDAKNKPWVYSKNWSLKINDIVLKNSINLIHIHGVWMFPQYIAAKYAFKNNISYVISPHGMFEPWLWTKGKYKKKIYFNLLTKKLYTNSNRIHAITFDEQQNLTKLFPKSKFVEIPNLVDFEKEDNLEERDSNEKYILFLGRLHEKKGIDLLISCFAELKTDNIVLKIVGSFNEYKLELDQLVNKYGIQEKVQFLGLIKGEEKKKIFRNAFVFIAPSYSEVVGMVNLEAAMEKTPVITTFQTGLNKAWNENGGLLINPNKSELKIALNKVLNWSDGERNKRGRLLFDFVKKHYSWSLRMKDWVEIYHRMINKK
ncbi:glycosyltransferase [Algibacter miyuki]|uniref:Glycosyltransferase n=1 Tax=Algibacter miyuki TaxID=1306933 RepID=A0ABV5GVC1_9FLAO|nr:glycosyltransferase [Algibacter miyuki]MDN3664914.1 glycosyltransferase [Algibacter miyuki]